MTKSAEIHKAAGSTTSLRQELLALQGEVSLWRTRIDQATEALEANYVEFVENRGQIEIFANLRMGRLTNEIVRPFDMADPFVVSQAQLDLWDPIYERSSATSASAIARKEGVDFLKAQAGATRKFIRDLNDKTSEFFGKPFTETEYGREFQKYEKHLAVVVLQRTAGLLGIVLTPVVIEKYGALIAQQIHNAVFGEKGAAGTSGTGPAAGGAKSVTGVPSSSASGAPAASALGPLSPPGASSPGASPGALSGANRIPDPADSSSIPRGGRIPPGVGIRP